MILHLADCGFPITNASIATPGFNDNDSCVKWCHNLISKGNRHIELKENVPREWIVDGAISVSHVNGKCNPAVIVIDLFVCYGRPPTIDAVSTTIWTVDKRLSKADVQDTNIILCPTTQSDYR